MSTTQRLNIFVRGRIIVQKAFSLYALESTKIAIFVLYCQIKTDNSLIKYINILIMGKVDSITFSLYSNLPFQTDVCGIKWIVFRENDHPATVDVSEDPVLTSYARCLESDLLTVWRRVPKRALTSNCSFELPTSGSSSKNSSDDKNVLTQRKELWIFWYGDKPEELLKKLVSSQLKEISDISGTWENVLPYEARTLFYKALNNLIERHVFLQIK